MISTAQYVLFAWPALAVVIFAFLPPRRAALVTLLGAWLFLPVAYYEMKGIEVNRWTSCSAGALFGVLLFDFRRFIALRPALYDLPIVTVALCPIASSMSNDLGFQDGLHEAVYRSVQLGIPYVIGRMYFHDPKGLREVAVGLFVGGLIYMPLCLFEIRMSPQLHTWIYGYHQHEFGQSARFGGWRPVVFMHHGLEVGMWMSAASLAGLWLWMTGALKKVLNVPVAALVPALLVTTVLCKSLGALALLGVGLAALVLTQKARSKALLVALLLCPVLYVTVRSTGLWSGDQLVSAAGAFGEERAQSVQYRFLAEDGLVRHALRQPVFGWGGWGRNRPSKFDEDTPDLATDGLWIINLGSFGFVGLISLMSTFLVPPLILLWRLRAGLWSHPWCAPAAILAVVMILFMIDCLMNAMVNPFYLVAAGGLSRAVRARQSRQPAGGPSRAAVAEGQLGIS